MRCTCYLGQDAFRLVVTVATCAAVLGTGCSLDTTGTLDPSSAGTRDASKSDVGAGDFPDASGSDITALPESSTRPADAREAESSTDAGADSVGDSSEVESSADAGADSLVSDVAQDADGSQIPDAIDDFGGDVTPIDATDDQAPDAAPPLICDPSDSSLVACYRFELLANPGRDESSFGNNALANNVFLEAGRDGNGLHTSTNSSVQVADSASLDLTRLTIDLWLKPDSLPTGARWGLWDNDGQYGLFLLQSGALRCALGVCSADTTTAVASAAWTHAACVYDGTHAVIYVNGVSQADVACSGDIPTGSTTGSRIGSNSPSGDSFPGVLDSLRIWNRALPTADICRFAGACP